MVIDPSDAVEERYPITSTMTCAVPSWLKIEMHPCPSGTAVMEFETVSPAAQLSVELCGIAAAAPVTGLAPHTVAKEEVEGWVTVRLITTPRASVGTPPTPSTRSR